MNKTEKQEAEQAEETAEQSLKTEEKNATEQIETIVQRLTENPEMKELIKEFDERAKDFSLQELLDLNQKLKEEIQQANQERDEYLSLLQKFKADFENYKKRIAKQNEHTIQLSSERILSKIFKPIDDLSRVIEFAEEQEQDTVSLEGISIIFNNLSRILEDEDVVVINPAPGDDFNPRYHEAISMDKTGKFEPDKVVRVFEKGYQIKEKVVRAAKVMVSAELPEQTSEEDKPGDASQGSSETKEQ
ncbi:MAG: nucleotide exchange factor GrpE [Candidatus Heimdallarchaeota archaeon]|nr:nucleotide exchange factor GrpE [Candidatus Heimdallarchaeota archaeon]